MARFHWVTALSTLSVLVLFLCQGFDEFPPLTSIASANSSDLGACAVFSHIESAPCGLEGTHSGIPPGQGFTVTLVFALTALLLLRRSIGPVRGAVGSLGEIRCCYPPATLRFSRRPGSIFLQVLRL